MLDTSSFYKPTEAGAYPIMLATYEIVCSKYSDAEVAKAVKAFLTVGYHRRPEGPRADNGYIPLPGRIQGQADNRHRRALLSIRVSNR